MSSPSGSDCGESTGDVDIDMDSSIFPDDDRSTQSGRGPTRQTSTRRRTRTASTSITSASEGPLVRAGTRTIYTAGRPPWYDSHGQLKEPFVIGLLDNLIKYMCGSASGKTTVARRIIEALHVQWVSLVCMDSFYKTLTEEQHEKAMMNEYNFDCPDAFDTQCIIHTLRRLKEGKNVDIPVYSFTNHRVEKHKKPIYGANVVIFEGIMAFVDKDIRDLMDMKVFVDTDSDVRLARRLRRDISERGRDLEGVLKQYHKFVKPAYDHHIEPTMVHADIIVPRGGENTVAVNLIVNHVHTKLVERGLTFRSKLKEAHVDQPLPHSLHVLKRTNQVVGLHTFIRNQYTARDEFIFYSKRLMRLLIEHSLSLLPFRKQLIDTPQGVLYEGSRMDVGQICGVSILRAGETLEPALCDVCKDVLLGKILIQTNTDTGEPELHYLRLPRDIKNCHVILMDATMATGAAAMMAIRVLLDHDVPEENIALIALIMALSGVHSVAYAFPKVKLITTEVDPNLNDQFHILPGIGNFGDRYFGTEPE